MFAAVVLDPDPVVVPAHLTLGEAIQQMQSQEKHYVVTEGMLLTASLALQFLSRDPQSLSTPLGDLLIPATPSHVHLIRDPDRQLRGVLFAEGAAPHWQDPHRAFAWIGRDLTFWDGNPTWTTWVGEQWQTVLMEIPWGSLVQEGYPHWHQEHALTTQDQQSRYVLTQVNAIGSRIGDPQGYAIEILDLSRDKERELTYAAIVKAIPDLMVKINRHGERKFFLPGRSLAIYEPDIATDLQKTVYDVLPPALANQRMEHVHRALETQTTQIYEYAIEVAGKHYFEEARVTPCNQDEVLVLIRNITAEKESDLQRQRHYDHLHLINAITQSIRQSLHLDTILNTVVREVRSLLHTNRVVIYQFQPDLVGTITAESVSDPRFSLLGETIEDSCFATHWHHSYQLGRVSSLSDIYTSPIQECHRQLLARIQVRANLVVPILSSPDWLWGLLIAHHCTGPYDWDPWMVDLLTDLAQQLAIAIQQAQLHHRLELTNSALQYQVNIRNAELQHLLDYEKLLRTITESVRANLSEESVLQETVNALVEGLGLKHCLIALFVDEDLTTHRIGYASSPAWEGLLLDLDPWVRQGLLTQQTVYCCGEHPLWGVGTAVAAPMYDQERLIGFLQLVREVEDEFSGAELRLAADVANQGAIGIRQARLYQDSRQQVRKLEELNRLKDEFVHMVSHELRTPLTNMNMALKMLEAKGVQDSQQRYFQILRSEWARELNLVNELLELQALESGTRGLAPVRLNLPDFLTPLTASFQFRTSERQQQLQIHIHPHVGDWVTDRSLLERVVVELLNNACKYTPPGERITLLVQPDQNQLGITVANTGIEIPPDRFPRIFEKFYRLADLDHWNQGGTGLGLSLVKKAVELLGGTLELHSQNLETSFHIRLPPLLPEAQRV